MLFSSLKNRKNQLRKQPRNVERVLRVIKKRIVADVTFVRYAWQLIECNVLEEFSFYPMEYIYAWAHISTSKALKSIAPVVLKQGIG